MSTEGTKTVTVSYQGKTAAFDIAVRNINITFAQLQDTSAVIAPAAVSRSGARTADIALAGAEGYTDIQWSVDGEAAGTGGSFTVDAWDYALGTHSVTVELKKDGAPYSKTVAFTVNK
jgi:hypothetical protein